MTEQELKSMTDAGYAKKRDTEPIYKVNTEVIDLPSGGVCYPDDHPLRSGHIELKYPTAVEESILMSKTLIKKGLSIDRFVSELIVDKTIDINTILVGDWEAIVLASRILALGPEYEANITCPSCQKQDTVTIDLLSIDTNEVEDTPLPDGTYEITLPKTKHVVKLRLLTYGDTKSIDAESNGMKKLSKITNIEQDNLITYKKMIISVNGDDNPGNVFAMIKSFPMLDTTYLRSFVLRNNPGVNPELTFNCSHCLFTGEERLPLGIKFFYPNGI